MKTLLRLLPLLTLTLAPLLAAADPSLDSVRQADDARVAATLAADRAGLAAIFSDELHYCHSSGLVNDKAALVDHIASGATKYSAFEYKERNFTAAGPGIVLMNGRCHVQVVSDGKASDLQLAFLAVWRNEAGTWRFLAWQSCKLP
jgi:hypothetical protein